MCYSGSHGQTRPYSMLAATQEATSTPSLYHAHHEHPHHRSDGYVHVSFDYEGLISYSTTRVYWRSHLDFPSPASGGVVLYYHCHRPRQHESISSGEARRQDCTRITLGSCSRRASCACIRHCHHCCQCGRSRGGPGRPHWTEEAPCRDWCGSHSHPYCTLCNTHFEYHQLILTGYSLAQASHSLRVSYISSHV
jgi:hypothetical protein